MILPSLVLKVTHMGKSVFAGRDFQKGETVLQVTGRLYRLAELPFPYEEGEDRYMQVDDDLFLGPTGDYDDFINHSCEPNTGIVIAKDGRTDGRTDGHILGRYKRNKERRRNYLGLLNDHV